MFQWIRDLPRNLRTIEWWANAHYDLWNWGIGLEVWYDAAPGFHFDSTGIEVRLGPFSISAGGHDTN